jgi:GDP-L-fucose synthase
MTPASRIFVAGHAGLAGSAIVDTLNARGFTNVITASHSACDLRDAYSVGVLFRRECPEYVINAAATIGGLQFSIDHPVAMLRDNTMIAINLLDACHTYNVKRTCVIATSCIYPRDAEQPMREDCLLTGEPEPTNRAYSIGKIAAVELARAYEAECKLRSVILAPTNLYGPGGFQGARYSHVIPSLMARMHAAKVHGSGAASVSVWGTGLNRREFLHVNDFADAVIYFMQHPDARDLINIGTGNDISIAALAVLMKEVVGYEGAIAFEEPMPGGMTQKLLNVSRARSLGWKASTQLRDGLRDMYAWFLKERA